MTLAQLEQLARNVQTATAGMAPGAALALAWVAMSCLHRNWDRIDWDRIDRGLTDGRLTSRPDPGTD